MLFLVRYLRLGTRLYSSHNQSGKTPVYLRFCQLPAVETSNLLIVLSSMYTFLDDTNFQRPCLCMRRSFRPEFAALVARPALREWELYIFGSSTTPSKSYFQAVPEGSVTDMHVVFNKTMVRSRFNYMPEYIFVAITRNLNSRQIQLKQFYRRRRWGRFADQYFIAFP